MPRAVLVALGTQVVLLPVICFGLVEAFGLAPALAVGMMLLVASPGGTTANLFSHLAGGAVYGIVMFFPTAAFAWLLNHRARVPAAPGRLERAEWLERAE